MASGRSGRKRERDEVEREKGKRTASSSHRSRRDRDEDDDDDYDGGRGYRQRPRRDGRRARSVRSDDSDRGKSRRRGESGSSSNRSRGGVRPPSTHHRQPRDDADTHRTSSSRRHGSDRQRRDESVDGSSGRHRHRRSRSRSPRESYTHAHASRPRDSRDEEEVPSRRWGRDAYVREMPEDAADQARTRVAGQDRRASISHELSSEGRGESWRIRRRGADQLDRLLEEHRARSGPSSHSLASHASRTTGQTETAANVSLCRVVLYGVERSVGAAHIRSVVEQLVGVRPTHITRPAIAAAVTARRADEAGRLVREAAAGLVGPPLTTTTDTVPHEGYVDDDEAVIGRDEEMQHMGNDSGRGQPHGELAGVLLAPPQISKAVKDGLYDAAGPGGVVVLGFERMEAAQMAATRLHGAVLNGLQIAASLC